MEAIVALKGMEFYAFHGYYPEERLSGNRFILDVWVKTHIENNDEDISGTVNYEDVYRICHKIMEIPKKLLETVAMNIIHDIKSELNVTFVKVKIKKIGPQLGGKVKSSEITLQE